MKIGDKVLKYCNSQNLSMVGFSQLLGANLRTVLSCATCNVVPQFSIISIMADKMGVSIRYLLDDDCVDMQQDILLNEAFRAGYSQYGDAYISDMLTLMKNIDVSGDDREKDRETVLKTMADSIFTARKKRD